MFLSGRYVQLRPVIPDDHPVLLSWCSAPHAYHRLARRGDARLFSDSVSDVEALLAGSMVLIVLDRRQNPVGYAAIFDVNPVDRRIQLDLFVVPKCPAILGMEAWLLLLDHVFAWFPVERVWRHLPEFAEFEHGIAMSMGFEVEGLLQDSLWLGDRFWPVHMLALSRERWSQFRDRFIDNLVIQAQYDGLTG